MSWLGDIAKNAGSTLGQGLLYLGAGLTAFGVAVGVTPHRDDSLDVINMATSPDRTGAYGHIFVPGDTGYHSGGLTFLPSRDDPASMSRSGWLEFIPSRDAPAEAMAPAEIPNAMDTFDNSMWFDMSIFETVSHADPVSTSTSYVLAVPERHVIADHSHYGYLRRIVDPNDLIVTIPPREYEANEFRNLPFYRYTFFVWLQEGAIPSNAIPDPFKPLNSNIGDHSAQYLFDDTFQAAIPSNYWGMIYAIPSNLSRQDLIDMGAIADRLPAAIPSNLTVEHLRDYGIPVVSPAIPSNAIPSNAIPSNAIPSNAIPSNAIPSNAIPSNAIPSNGIPPSGFPTNLMPTLLSVLEQLDPEDLFQEGTLEKVQLELFQPEIRGLFLTGDESYRRRGRIVVDAQARESEAFRSLISDLWEQEYGVETAWSSSDNRVYMACSDSCETVALPYTTAREQAPYVGVETVSIGPSVGIETVPFGETVACTEDLTGVEAWLGHKYSGNFAVQMILASGESYQFSAYELSIDNQLFVDCVFDVENPRVLHCIRDGITPERWVDFVLTAQPSGCEVWGGTFYVCPYDETYHAPNPWWDGTYGLCCSNGCWCTLPGGETGCFNNCPDCDH
ncbi:MAG: hypothetical protein PVI78_12530 [Anaerolineales bacterium]|jgi:hypothetical protein